MISTALIQTPWRRATPLPDKITYFTVRDLFSNGNHIFAATEYALQFAQPEILDSSQWRSQYHQRGPLEHTFFGPFPRLVLGCINADFYDQGRIFPHFSSSTSFSFAPFQISVIFQAFAQFFAKVCEFLRIFSEESRFCKFSSNFNGSFPEFRTISTILQWVMPSLLSFRKFWENLQKIRRNFAANFPKICLKKSNL